MKSIKKIILILLGGILLFIIVSTTYENIVYHNKLNNFLKDQVLLEEKSTDNNKYYYKTNSQYYTTDSYINPGFFCDILVTTDSSIEIPVIHDLLDLTVGGHAGFCGMKYQDKYYTISNSDTIDTAYNDLDNKTTIYPASKWNESSEFPNYYILRVSLTENESYIVYNELVSNLGEPYNLTFLLNTKTSSYCSDLISKAFRKVKKNLNYDFGPTTVIDLLASKYTEIVGYKVSKNNVNYYYTL